jgi:non-ribosomal peptide synthetase component F
MAPRTPNPDVSGYRTLEHRAHRRGGPDSFGQRLDQLFEARCDWLGARGRSGQVAVDCHYAVLTHQELDCRANQLARYLLSRGAAPGDRIGLLLDRGADSYIAMLAVLKIHAACVPLHTSFAADRISYITGDADVRILVSVTSLADHLPHPGERRWCSSTRLPVRSGPAGPLASTISITVGGWTNWHIGPTPPARVDDPEAWRSPTPRSAPS